MNNGLTTGNTIQYDYINVVWGDMMTLFSQENHTAIQDVAAGKTDYMPNVETAMTKLSHLHDRLHPQLVNNGLDLHPVKQPNNIVFESASTSTKRGIISLQYMRPRAQAIRVERLMGRDETSNNGIEARRHPVIEVRLTPSHLTVEMILSPYAWWDQQNFVGKMSVDRHRANFYDLLKKLDDETKVGYWRGVALEEMYVKVSQIYNPNIWNEWFDTFDPGKDWFRLGVWYTPEADDLSEETIIGELTRQIRGLYTLYDDILWSSNNNYREFYKGGDNR